MDPAHAARERAIELAMESLGAEAIRNKLDEEGLGGHLELEQIDEIVVESVVSRSLQGPRSRYTGTRVVGVIALCLGLIVLGICLQDLSFHEAMNRESPAGYGLIAILLGLLLILKPSLGREEV